MTLKSYAFLGLLFGWIALLAGCNCDHQGSGWVVDRTTGQPLEKVEVSIYLSTVHDDSLPRRVYTDADGHFALSHTYCTNYMIDFYKEGFIGHVTHLPQGDTIYLERLGPDDIP